MRFFSVLLMAAMLLFGAVPVTAQTENTPPLPQPIQNLVDEGAQIRYLGRFKGMDGWIAIQNGQEQYFYVKEDRSAFVMGLLFDNDGKLVTLDQVAELQSGSDAEYLDMLALENDVQAQKELREAAENENRAEFKTPSEQLFANVEESNWIALGNSEAPVIYTFMDPQCPHCHSFMDDLRRNYIENGLVQVRMVPVGFRDETRAQAAFLLAAPQPENRWYRHLDGDKDALPVTNNMNQQGVQRNLAIMQSWKINVTPFSVYRAKDGTVKIIQGRAQNVADLLDDLS